MRLIVPENKEPDWGEEDELNEEPIDLTLSAEIVGLTAGVGYAVFKFESSSKLPTSNFAESTAWTNSWQFTAESDTH